MKQAPIVWIVGGLLAAFGTAAIAGSGTSTSSGQFKTQNVRVIEQPIQTVPKPWTVRIYNVAWTFTPLTKVLPDIPKVNDLIEIDRSDGGSVWNMTLAKVTEVGPTNENREVRVMVTFQAGTFGKP